MSTYDQRGQRVNTQINIAGLTAAGGCPSCNLIDKVEKVTTIFSSGISGTTTLSANSQSLLSERLAPPVRPSLQGKKDWTISIVVAIVLFLCGLLSIDSIFDNKMIEVVPGIIFAIVGIGGGIVLWVGANRGKKKREAELAAKIPHWEKAMARWKNLYYCARDDGVFDLDERILVPTEEIMDYLYR